jgi:DNA sulfur modification protein DndC
MAAMIQNDEEKEWMLPLLELRNELGQRDDRHRRDFRRMSGRVQLFHDRPIPGPYKQSVREYWLRRVLDVEAWLRAHGPDEVRDIELISMAELVEIRRIWVMDKHEIEDRLPRIYEEVRGKPFAGRFDDSLVFGATELGVLREVCGEDELHYELARELLDIEWRARTKLRRAGLFDALEQAFQRNFFADQSDAVEHARRRRDALARDMLDDDTTSDDS